MDNIKAKDILLRKAIDGVFGTPDSPLRNGGSRKTFWDVYFGFRKASEYKGTVSYPMALAAKEYKNINPLPPSVL